MSLLIILCQKQIKIIVHRASWETNGNIDVLFLKILNKISLFNWRWLSVHFLNYLSSSALTQWIHFCILYLYTESLIKILSDFLVAVQCFCGMLDRAQTACLFFLYLHTCIYIHIYTLRFYSVIFQVFNYFWLFLHIYTHSIQYD